MDMDVQLHQQFHLVHLISSGVAQASTVHAPTTEDGLVRQTGLDQAIFNLSTHYLSNKGRHLLKVDSRSQRLVTQACEPLRNRQSSQPADTAADTGS